MKSIRDFIEGKIRRTESADRLALETAGAAKPVHPVFGRLEGVLVGPKGRVAFYEAGLVLEGGGGAEIAYAEIERVMIEPRRGSGSREESVDGPAARDERFVDLVLAGGATKRLVASPIGGEVVYATLRWIGSVHLGRKLA